MSVIVKTIKPLDRVGCHCSKCSRLPYFEMILDVDISVCSIAERACGREDCKHYAINKMIEYSKLLGYPNYVSSADKAPKKRKERKEIDTDDIPWMLENWGKARLGKLNKANLVDLCVERGIPKSGSKPELASNLIRWKDAGGHWKTKKGRTSF